MAKQRLDATWLQCRQTTVCKVFATAEGERERERNRNRGRQTTWIRTMPSILSLSLFFPQIEKASKWPAERYLPCTQLSVLIAVSVMPHLSSRFMDVPPPSSLTDLACSSSLPLLSSAATHWLSRHRQLRVPLSLFLNLRHNPLLLFLFYPNPLPVCPLSVAIATRL